LKLGFVNSYSTILQVITQESLLAAQREDLLRVMELLSIKEHHARTLLIHYQWDVEKLFAVFVEKGKDSLFSGAGVTVFDYQYGNSSFPQSSQMSCDVCMEDLPGDHMTRMDCGHCFCNNCEYPLAVICCKG
jgi:ariadne-1